MSDLYYSASDRADLDEEHDRPPLSFAQEQLWFFERMTPGTTIYNVPLIFRLRGGLDAGVLGRALTEVVRRHEALRTTFGFANGSPYQVIAPATPVDIRLDDLSGIDAGARDAEAIRLVTQEVRTPFDLNRGLLVRARLIRIDRADHVFCLTMHHICTDGWSRGLIVSELSEVYGGLAGGGVPALGELPVQYADFAVWQREWLRGEVLESALRYWEERLAGLPVLELPTDR
ncbi:MAG TPA: condensation domain-containing protein, partial [Streptosporangiaceae bacterium]|nr:condensation domain-containing protein [Streptosporangiaceae bacterium]